MKKGIFSAILFLLTTAGFSQNFSFGTAAYTNLVGSTKLTDSIWDNYATLPENQQKVALGFTFDAFFNPFDTIYLDEGGIWSYDYNVYVGLFENLCDRGLGGIRPKSPVSVLKIGGAGNRIVKIQWRNFGFKGDYNRAKTLTDSGNIQLWIYENPQKIELRFGPSVIAHFRSDFPLGPIVNCSFDDGSGSEDGLVVKGNPANPTTSAYTSANEDTLTGFPTNGQMYIFNFTTANTSNLVLGKLNYWVANNNIYSAQNGANIEVYSLDGKKLKTIYDADAQESVADLPAGAYVAKMHLNDKIEQIKFIKSE